MYYQKHRALREVNMESDLREQKINIRGVSISYVKTGNGEHPILLLPGTLGSLWYQFESQIKELDRNRFTIVAWDPPGCGRSRPPNWTFSEDYIQRDAAFANDFMHALGHKTFSLIGFCGGGRTSLVLAALYPDSVRKIIVISTNSYLLPEEMVSYKITRNVDIWPDRQRNEMVGIYGYDGLKSVWSSWVNGLLNMCEKQNGDICTNFLEKIQCQTLIVYGAKDDFINQSHAAFLNSRIRHSRVHAFEKGQHHLHLKYSNEFNDLATDFLSSAELI